MNEELQKQIDELRATIDLLKNGDTTKTIPHQMNQVRKQAIQKYYGNWVYFRDTDIQICPKKKGWNDFQYLSMGMERLINIMYKHGRDICNSISISEAVTCEADLREYEEISNYIVETMVNKIKEMRERHGIEKREQIA